MCKLQEELVILICPPFFGNFLPSLLVWTRTGSDLKIELFVPANLLRILVVQSM
jgi:hypothetical protein